MFRIGRTLKRRGKAPGGGLAHQWEVRVSPARILQMFYPFHLKRFDIMRQFGLTKFRSSDADKGNLYTVFLGRMENFYPVSVLCRPNLVIVPFFVHPRCCQAYPVNDIRLEHHDNYFA